MTRRETHECETEKFKTCEESPRPPRRRPLLPRSVQVTLSSDSFSLPPCCHTCQGTTANIGKYVTESVSQVEVGNKYGTRIMDWAPTAPTTSKNEEVDA